MTILNDMQNFDLKRGKSLLGKRGQRWKFQNLHHLKRRNKPLQRCRYLRDY